MNKKTMELDDTNDFGFSFADTDEVSAPVVQSASATVEEMYKQKLQEVEKLILPLLYNLMKNPEKPFIKWENRVPVIQKQIDRITAITRS
jgi:hypothetical protein